MALYEKMRYGENLGWCVPYEAEVNGHHVVWCENELDICGFCLDGTDVDEIVNGPNKGEAIHKAAVMLNADYGEYEGWDDLHILKEALHDKCHTLGCADCPWRNDCEAMDEED